MGNSLDKDLEGKLVVLTASGPHEGVEKRLFRVTGGFGASKGTVGTALFGVLSRCIARINYECPSVEDQVKIWRVLADLNHIPLIEAYIAENVKRHPTLAGRDIKQLLKLAVLHTAKAQEEITPEIIDFVAQFQPTIKNGGGK